MVEPWSSKPYVWVRFPLSLNIILRKPTQFLSRSVKFNIKKRKRHLQNLKVKLNRKNFKNLMPYKSTNTFRNYNTFFSGISSIGINSNLPQNVSYIPFFKKYAIFTVLDAVKVSACHVASSKIGEMFVNLQCYTNYYLAYMGTNSPVDKVKSFFNMRRYNDYTDCDRLTTHTSSIYYLEYHLSLLIHNYLLNKVNKNRMFCLYPVNSSHFYTSNSFSPPLENIIKFKKFMFKGVNPQLFYPSIFTSKLLYNFFNVSFTKHTTTPSSLFSNLVKLLTTTIPIILMRSRSLHYTNLRFKVFSLRRILAQTLRKLNKFLYRRRKRSLLFIKPRNTSVSIKKKFTNLRIKKLSILNMIYKPNLSILGVSTRPLTLKKLYTTSVEKFTNKSINNYFSFNLSLFRKSLFSFLFFSNPLFLKSIDMANLLYGK